MARRSKKGTNDNFIDFEPIKEFELGSNVLEIKVPEHIKQKVSSGITWLDECIGGKGFTPTTCGMVTGTPGAGKTTFMLQLADSITKTGNIALFNTVEESLYQVGLTRERLKLKNGFLVGQECMTTDLLKHVGELSDKNPGKKIFLLIDSLQCMNDGKYADGGMNGNTPVRVAKMLTEFVKNRTNVITLFVGQVTKSGEFAGKNSIKHMLDMHLHIYIDLDRRSETWGERIFTNRKNRFGYSGKTYILGLEDDGLYQKGKYL